jgi:hypothetical protein
MLPDGQEVNADETVVPQAAQVIRREFLKMFAQISLETAENW